MARTRRALHRATRPALDRGASAVEYGLMVAAIAALIVGVAFGLGKVVQNAFANTSQCLSGHPVPACPDAGPGGIGGGTTGGGTTTTGDTSGTTTTSGGTGDNGTDLTPPQ